MAFYKRLIENHLFEFGKKMIFLYGPRQSGKTTLAKNLLGRGQGAYLNWDDLSVRREYFKNPHFLNDYLSGKTKALIVFDEIHKIKNWKNILKGLYDVFSNRCTFIVTGSARLDLFLRAGDSLAGRYFSYKLTPFGVSEFARDMSCVSSGDNIFRQDWLLNHLEKIMHFSRKFEKSCKTLFKYNSFPEVAIKKNWKFLNKWQKAYVEQVAREDVAQLSNIENLKTIENLVLLLPERTGNQLSLSGLSVDLEISYKTVKSYLEILKRVFLIFEVPPYNKKLARAIKKEKKIYFYDYSLIENQGNRFENFAALNLLNLIDGLNDSGQGKYELNYLKDKDGNETDFVIIKNSKPILLIECKLSETDINKGSLYWARKMNLPLIQLVYNLDRYKIIDSGIFVLPAWRYLCMCS